MLVIIQQVCGCKMWIDFVYILIHHISYLTPSSSVTPRYSNQKRTLFLLETKIVKRKENSKKKCFFSFIVLL